LAKNIGDLGHFSPKNIEIWGTFRQYRFYESVRAVICGKGFIRVKSKFVGKDFLAILTQVASIHAKENGHYIGIKENRQYFRIELAKKSPKLAITTLTPCGRCYDHNFLRFSTIFGKKNWRFPKSQCYDQIFGIT
jgi:hypothetical protein